MDSSSSGIIVCFVCDHFPNQIRTTLRAEKNVFLFYVHAYHHIWMTVDLASKMNVFINVSSAHYIPHNIPHTIYKVHGLIGSVSWAGRQSEREKKCWKVGNAMERIKREWERFENCFKTSQRMIFKKMGLAKRASEVNNPGAKHSRHRS